MLPKFVFQDIIRQKDQQTTASAYQNPLKLRKPLFKAQGVKLTKGTEHILLPSFCMLILGKPGAGKSHLINQLIDQQNFYKYKFDRILYIGPTRYQSCIHDDYNTSTLLDTKFIDKRLSQCQGWAQNILIIFDDVISQVPTTQKSRLQQLFFNRRHQLKRGTISIMITSQKFTSVPTWIRSTINTIFCFNITKNQIKILFNQIPLISNAETTKKSFQNLDKHDFVYFNLEKGKTFNKQFEQL